MAAEHRHSHRRPPPAPPVVAPQSEHEQHPCPACGRPVDTVLRRRKALGVFVPEWVPGPCRNPDCAEYAAEEGRVP
ncbi:MULTISPECIES: hypothetical protein [Streptomyces]|uniref:hypothetical protein n=1 Tax=Streptomyces TaxID=1883 RepID=UPI002F945C9A